MSQEIKKFICFLTLIALTSCSPTKPSGKSLSGKIILEGANNFSSVKVLLYNLPQIDTSILKSIKKYPTLFSPVDINFYFFDHRRQIPIAYTFTDQNGNFTLSNIPEGEYILFVQKDGYGWNYIKISTSSKIPDIYLKREIHISGVLQGDNFWEFGNYVIDGDVEVPNGASLYISHGSIIRFNGNFKIKVKGNFGTMTRSMIPGPPSFPIIFTSDDTLNIWGGIYIANSGKANIDFSVFRDAEVGVFVEGASLSIANSMFINNKNYGVSAVQIGAEDSVLIKNSIFTQQPIGVNFEFTDTTASVENSIFITNFESGIYATTSGVRIKENYFANNKYSVRGYSNTGAPVLKIYQNCFASSFLYHIYLRGLDSEIKYNEINSTSGGISLGDMYLKTTHSVINYNNLTGKRYLLRLGSFTSNTDARLNYWGTVSEAEIKNLIFDRNDVPSSDPNYNRYGVVDYSNYFAEPIKEAGIR